MRRYRTASSAVTMVGYDASRRRLEVEFKGGGLYAYLDVTPAEYGELLAADSIGDYVNTRIKPRHESTMLKRSPAPRL